MGNSMPWDTNLKQNGIWATENIFMIKRDFLNKVFFGSIAKINVWRVFDVRLDFDTNEHYLGYFILL